MNITNGLALAVLVLVSVWPLTPSRAADRVELELVTEKGFPITGAQEWMRALKDVGAQVRIRGENPGDSPSIKTRGTGESRTHVVVGILTARDALILPGGKFGIRDKQRIADWVASLKTEGADGVTAERGAFGLTNEQLLAVHAELAAPAPASTKGVSLRKALNGIVGELKLKVVVDSTALRDVPPEEVLLDELQGVSTGTALAAALRPYGLAFAPRKPAGGNVELYVAAGSAFEEAWPIGWPVERNLQEVAPALFKFLQVEIDDTPLSDALAAVGGRIDAPMLFDHNSLARERIDMTKVEVSLPAKRSYYKEILDRMLGQARLQVEVRADEADHPFLWISTIRQ